MTVGEGFGMLLRKSKPPGALVVVDSIPFVDAIARFGRRRLSRRQGLRMNSAYVINQQTACVCKYESVCY